MPRTKRDTTDLHAPDRVAAENSILAGTVLTVSSRAYRELLKRMDAAPQPNERLRKSMQTAPPWK